MLSEKEVKPFLRIDTRHNHLIFNRAVHDLLGCPPYFMFYWRKDTNALYVAPQNEDSRHAFAIPRHALKNYRLEILCQRSYLFDDLRRRMGWKPGRLYKAYGSFDTVTGMICFPLENTQIMEGIET